MMKTSRVTPLGLYIHIPFCLQKCAYCDFYSEAGQNEEVQQAYANALIKEIRFFGSRGGSDGCRRVDTIFIGGGTPSILRPQLLADILAAVDENFFVEPDAEISLECNPATLDDQKLAAYRDMGINRISMGVQSMDEGLLKIMGRVHSSQDVLDSYRQIRGAGFTNVNLDVMFGVPTQTMGMWRDTVKQVLDLEPAHLSFYSLELAEGTRFYQLLAQGRLKETAPELDRRMYHYLLDELRQRGYEQYEISNGAKPGYRCRHNLKYWNLEEYLGLGASAHSYIGHRRWANTADLREYILCMKEQEIQEAAGEGMLTAAAVWSCENKLIDDITDYTFTALRKCEGIDLGEFAQRFGVDFWDVFKGERTAFEKFCQRKEAALDRGRLYITEAGMDIANQIIALFVGVAESGEESENG